MVPSDAFGLCRHKPVRGPAVGALVAASLALVVVSLVPTNTASSIMPPALAAPQDPLVTEFNRRQKLFETKRYDEVTQGAAEFLEQVRSRLGEDSKLFELTQMMFASAYNMADRFADAALYLEQRLARLDEKRAADEWTLFTLGRVYWQLGRYGEAAPLLARALSIMEKTFKPDDTRTLVALGHLAATYEQIGRNEEAKLLYERAVANAEKALGPNHPHIATHPIQLGQTLSLRLRRGRTVVDAGARDPRQGPRRHVLDRTDSRFSERVLQVQGPLR
jgi:tetratricopeptide (TPR) repeat protein